MKLQGSFVDKKDNRIEVIINNKYKDGTDMVIGCSGDDTSIKFSNDPLTIEENLDTTFDVFIMKSGKLDLVTSLNLCEYLFANSHDSVIITINKNGKCIFKGYVEPNVYSQDYAEHLVTMTINFTDFLSTLQYKKLSDGTSNNWISCVAEANTRTFGDYFRKFGFFDFGKVWYDGSKKVFDPTSSSNYTNKDLFSQIGITDTLFLGDDEDSEMTGEDIIKEILQYLDLHIVQEGTDFYIFDWSTMKSPGTVTFYKLDNTATTTTIDTTNVYVNKDFYSDDSTQIEISDVYNQVKVKCDIDDVDTIIESPLDKDSLSSFYPKKLRYCTEMYSYGDGNGGRNGLNDLVNKGYTGYSGAKVWNWYMRPMINSNWKFKISSSALIQDIYPKNSSNEYYKQWYVGKYMKTNTLIPSIISLGKKKFDKGIGSDDVQGKIDMSNYLYISLNGNEDDSENGHYPSDAMIQSRSGMIEYTGQNQAISLSPTDDTTVNYIIFSGKMMYMPIVYESSSSSLKKTGTYYECKQHGVNRTEHGGESNVVHGLGPNWEEGYYTRKFWTPDDVTESDNAPYMTSGTNLSPFNPDTITRNFQYNYSTTTDGRNAVDRYKKLPMIECEMTVGNKRLIETNIDKFGNSTFKWVKIGSEPTDMFGNKITTFSLGCNPKLEDYIIGTEFDMQNTVTTDMNLDTEGTAIPIRKSDALSGRISFKILGPVNLTWDDITRRHPSFWHHTKWTTNTKFILAHSESLIIKDFACKIHSDNAGMEQDQDKDLIYISDMTHNYIKSKDDITMKINTLLTSEEAYQLGVKNTVNLSSAIDMTTNLPLYGISKNGVSESVDANHKPEKFYVDAYYNEYNKPKVILNTQFHNLDIFNRFSTFVFNYFNGKAFYPINASYNLMDDTVDLKLKEGATYVKPPVTIKTYYIKGDKQNERKDVEFNKDIFCTGSQNDVYTLHIVTPQDNVKVKVNVYTSLYKTSTWVVCNDLDDDAGYNVVPDAVNGPNYYKYWNRGNANDFRTKWETLEFNIDKAGDHFLRFYGQGSNPAYSKLRILSILSEIQ